MPYSADAGIHPYATLPADPTTAAQVSWLDARAGADGSEMTLVGIGGSHAVTGVEVAGSGVYRYEVEVSGLTADTLYEATIEDGATVVANVPLRTFPAALPAGGIKIVVVSDLHIDYAGAMDSPAKMQPLADALPDMLLIAGDHVSDGDTISSGDTSAWIEWFSQYVSRLHVAKDRIVPILPVPGNHDVGNDNFDGASGGVNPDAGYFQTFYANPKNLGPVGENYGAVSFGDYLQLLALDTHSAYAEDVGTWIGNNIDATKLLCLPFHHAPLFRGGARYDSGADQGVTFMANLRNAYARRFFEAGNVKATFSGHVHVRKRSVPWGISESDPGGDSFQLSDGGFIHEQAGGIVEFGDGYLDGRNLWDPQPWYVEEATNAGNQFFVLTVEPTLLTVDSRDGLGTSFDTKTFTLEAGTPGGDGSTPVDGSDVTSGMVLLPDAGTGNLVLRAAGALDYTVPGGVQNLVATRGDAEVTAAWDPPKTGGGSPITGYSAELRRSSDDSLIASAPGVTSPHTFTSADGAVNGTSYYVRVRATNLRGSSAWTTSGSVTPESDNTPGPVVNLSATAGDATITATWSEPSDVGGGINDYDTRLVRASDSAVIATDNVAAYTKAYGAADGVVNGTAYYVEVRAVSGSYYGPWQQSGSVTPASGDTAPGQVGAINATAGDATISATWGAPADDGGSAVTAYNVSLRLASDDSEVTSKKPASQNVSFGNADGVVNGTAYYLRISAENAVGTGPFRDSAEVTPTGAAMAPGSVQALVATSGDRQVHATWDPPASDGGSAVTGYGLELVNDASGTVVASASGYADTDVTFDQADGVDNGTAYVVRVRASNAAGVGPWSASNAVTPSATAVVPGAPQNVSATPGSEPGSVTIAWDPPASDGGASITRYRITITQTA